MDQGLTLQIEGHHPLVHHQGQQLSRLMGSALELVTAIGPWYLKMDDQHGPTPNLSPNNGENEVSNNKH